MRMGKVSGLILGTSLAMATTLALGLPGTPAAAQTLQRETAQPLGAAATKPNSGNGPATPSGTRPTASSTSMATPAPTAPAPTGPGATNPAPQRFRSEADAKTACGSQPVVWGNTRSKVFYGPGMKYYGKTRRGSFMCQDTAMAGGYHAAKS